ncbi:NAD-dependent epimerase/dehydratase family protein [Verrucomicrobiota bacterium sgz303538]
MLLHVNGTRAIQTVEHLEHLLSNPTEAVVEMMSRLQGDIILLGVGGKIGPSLARMAKCASEMAGVHRRVIGVSRFSNPEEEAGLQAHNIETIRCDLLDEAAVAQLPDAPNVLYLAGLKFGSNERAAETWAMNTHLPSVICRKFRSSRIVAYSTGAVYGMARVDSGGSRETDAPEPVGEYAMSCLGRERMFEYFSKLWNIPMVLVRLFYACEVRYGVLVDIARKVMAGDLIDLRMGHFNIIWQGDNNAMTLLALDHVASPPLVLNVTGPELLSVRKIAETMGMRMGKRPRFCGTEAETTCIGNAENSFRLMSRPRIGAEQLIEWIVDWVMRDGHYHGKPTHFEVRNGQY